MNETEVQPGINARTGRWMGLLFPAVALAGLVITLIARKNWWFPPLASEHGVYVDRLFTTILMLIGLVFVLVHGLLGYFVWRFSRPGRERAIHWLEDKRLELLWTLIPAAVLVTLTVMGGMVWANMHTPAPGDALTIEVTAEQFGWRVRYPGPDGAFGNTVPALITRENPLGLDPGAPSGDDDIVLLNDLRIPVDQPVRLLLRSKDVIHSFFVPGLRVKQDTLPGRTFELTFVPTRMGEYEIACAELCGAGHFAMRGLLTVLSQAEFDAWLAEQSAEVER